MTWDGLNQQNQVELNSQSMVQHRTMNKAQ